MTPKPAFKARFSFERICSVLHGTYLLTYIYDIIKISLYEILSGIRVSKGTAVKKSTQEHPIGYDGGLYFPHTVDRPIDRFYGMISDRSARQKNFLPSWNKLEK